tara:strand:- start:43 stop:594 length:552 start_codon:yes stop_codon:yes gene_type:complete
MIPDPGNTANQAYITQQYAQQASTTPHQIYYQNDSKETSHLSSFMLAVIPNIIIFSAFLLFAFFYGLFDGELDEFLEFFSYYLFLYWLFTSFSVTMLSTYLAFNHKASKLWQVIGPPLGFLTSFLTFLLISAIFDSDAFFDNFGDDVLPVFGAALIAHVLISLTIMLLLTFSVRRDYSKRDHF